MSHKEKNDNVVDKKTKKYHETGKKEKGQEQHRKKEKIGKFGKTGRDRPAWRIIGSQRKNLGANTPVGFCIRVRSWASLTRFNPGVRDVVS